jgi:hypothetical protein
MSKALGAVSKLAHEAELNVNAVYRMRSTQGKRELKGPSAVLRDAVHNPSAAQSVASITDRRPSSTKDRMERFAKIVEK